MADNQAVESGDIVAYEFADPHGEWLWSVGRVLALTHPRVMTLAMWVPQKKKNISSEEQKRAAATMENIASKQQQLGDERACIQRLVTELTVKSQQVQSRMDECEIELADVLPVLEEAKKALGGVSLKELREIKAYREPPVVVKLVMEAVLTVIGEGKKSAEWDFVKLFITDIGFMPRVKYFDPIEMTPDTIKKVTKIAEHPDFNFDRAQRASQAAGPLQKWVAAQLQYINAVPDHLKPKLEEARMLKQELREVEESKLDNETRVSQIEAEVKKMLQQYNDLLHGEGVRVNYDKDGLACLTREIPGGAWTPVDNQRKICIVRSSALCILASPGRNHTDEYVFDREAAEMVRSAVNVNGQTIIKPLPKGGFSSPVATTVAAARFGRSQRGRTEAARTPTPPSGNATTTANDLTRIKDPKRGSRRSSTAAENPEPRTPPEVSTKKSVGSRRSSSSAQAVTEKKKGKKNLAASGNLDRSGIASASQSLNVSGYTKDGIPSPPPLQPLPKLDGGRSNNGSPGGNNAMPSIDIASASQSLNVSVNNDKGKKNLAASGKSLDRSDIASASQSLNVSVNNDKGKKNLAASGNLDRSGIASASQSLNVSVNNHKGKKNLAASGKSLDRSGIASASHSFNVSGDTKDGIPSPPPLQPLPKLDGSRSNNGSPGGNNAMPSLSPGRKQADDPISTRQSGMPNSAVPPLGGGVDAGAGSPDSKLPALPQLSSRKTPRK